MFLPVGLVVVLALTTSLANVQATEYELIKMEGATPYKDIVCPEACTTSMNQGLNKISAALNGELKTASFPVDFCQQCQLSNLGNFEHKIKCFRSPKGDVFDHHFTITFPDIAARCQCMLSNNPSEAAKSVNGGKLIEGQCGKENFKNTHNCESIQCDGGDGSGSENVSLAVDLKGSRIEGVLRVDTRKNETNPTEGAFPLSLTLITPKPAEITHQASEKFDESWKCLTGNNQNELICRLFAKAPAPFFECLTPATDANIIHAILYLYGKCKKEE